MDTGARPWWPERIGRFDVRGHLGSGAFAAVFLAHDASLDADVAIKLLGDHHAVDPDVRARFVGEARALRSIHDERVVTMHDIGEWEGRPFLVMEYVGRETLADRLGVDAVDGGSVDRATLAHLVAEVAACLRVVHRAGLVHRDVKPSNLLIRPGRGDGPADDRPTALRTGERLCLADFGLARPLDASSLTVGGGTVGFLAPEQRVPSSTVDHRADLYSASVVVAVAAFGDAWSDAVADARTPLAHSLSEGTATSPDDRPLDVDAWERRVLDALDERGAGSPRRPRRRATLVTLAGVGAVLVFGVSAWVRDGAESEGVENTTAIADGRTGEDGPQVIGPDELLLGEVGRFRHEDRAGVSYEWTLPDGTSSDAVEVAHTPTAPEPFVVRLTEIDGERVRVSEFRVEVRTR